MGALVLLASGLLVGSSVAGCVTPLPSSIDLEVGAATGLVSPPGFEQWLHEQCPDGSVLRIVADAKAHDTACENIREEIFADAAMHGRAVDTYLKQAASLERAEEPMLADPSGERIGEAKQRGLISGFLCGLIVNGLLAYQCDKVKMHWSSCFVATIPPSILCLVIPIP